MDNNNIMYEISSKLYLWYQKNKRDLPWRLSKDPYIIWVSEIILQQTRIIQGTPYFNRFIEKYPTVKSLAEAQLSDVLLVWQGLGYYSRARNMHKTAKQIMNGFNGNFPTSKAELLNLPGIGNYTSAAIASFAFNENVSVLDGNVIRFISRLFNISLDISLTSTQNILKEKAQSLLPKVDSDIHNQAIMEFGALQCIPGVPDCTMCVLQDNCLAYLYNTQSSIPFKAKKGEKKVRYFNYLVFEMNNNQFYLKERSGGDIWHGLYDFFLIESDELVKDQYTIFKLLNDKDIECNITFKSATEYYKHILTHQLLFVKFWMFTVKTLPDYFVNENNLILLKVDEIKLLPKPIIIKNYIESILE